MHVQDFLGSLVRKSGALKDFAEPAHKAWYDGEAVKIQHRDDFAMRGFGVELSDGTRLGYGKRVRVVNLTPAQRAELNIPQTASDSDNVCNENFLPYSELPPSVRVSNEGHVLALCYLLLMWAREATTTEQVLAILDQVGDGSFNPALTETGACLTFVIYHVNWRASHDAPASTDGDRQGLSDDNKSKDDDGIRRAAAWLASQVRATKSIL